MLQEKTAGKDYRKRLQEKTTGKDCRKRSTRCHFPRDEEIRRAAADCGDEIWKGKGKSV